MKLQEFIRETIKEYIAGVKEAQEYAAAHGAKVHPPSKKAGQQETFRMVDPTTWQLLQNVEFDVAVTSTEGSEAKATAGIFVAAIGLGAQGKTDMSSSTVSRIKFSVPVALPIQRE